MGNCVRREVGLDFDNQPGSIDKMRERIMKMKVKTKNVHNETTPVGDPNYNHNNSVVIEEYENDLEYEREMEKERQMKLQRKLEKERERERIKQLEMERLIEIEREIERQREMDNEMEKERERERQLEIERQMEREMQAKNDKVNDYMYNEIMLDKSKRYNNVDNFEEIKRNLTINQSMFEKEKSEIIYNPKDQTLNKMNESEIFDATKNKIHKEEEENEIEQEEEEEEEEMEEKEEILPEEILHEEILLEETKIEKEISADAEQNNNFNNEELIEDEPEAEIVNVRAIRKEPVDPMIFDDTQSKKESIIMSEVQSKIEKSIVLSEAKSLKEKSIVKLSGKEESIIMSEVQSKKENSIVFNQHEKEKSMIASEIQSKKDESVLNISKKEKSFISYSQSKKEIEKEKNILSIQPEKENSLIITPTEPEKEKSIIITQPIEIIKEESIIKSKTPILENPVILPTQRTNLPRPKPTKTGGPQVMIRNFSDQEFSEFSYTPY